MTRSDKARVREARKAIERLLATYVQGDNRFGEYGVKVLAAIARHERTIEDIQNKETCK